MVLHHLRKGLKIGAESIRMSVKMVRKELAPLIKAHHLTEKDAKRFTSEAIALGKKAKSRAAALAKAETKRIITKLGYVSKAEVDSLKKRVISLERKLKAKARR
jgi:polyhydroxyalkanoate synthesis regulator phasin